MCVKLRWKDGILKSKSGRSNIITGSSLSWYTTLLNSQICKYGKSIFLILVSFLFFFTIKKYFLSQQLIWRIHSHPKKLGMKPKPKLKFGMGLGFITTFFWVLGMGFGCGYETHTRIFLGVNV